MNSTCSECLSLASIIQYGINMRRIKLKSLVSMALKYLALYPITSKSSRKMLLNINFVLCNVQYILQKKLIFLKVCESVHHHTIQINHHLDATIKAHHDHHDQQHWYYYAQKVKPEAATAVVKLLMMEVRTPETCWGLNKCQVIKLERLLHLVGDLYEKLIFSIYLIFMDPCILVWLSRNNQQDATL